MRYRISPLLCGALMLLTLQPASTLRAQAPVKEFQQPNAYAVVIGISQYREEVVPKIAYATKDAEAVAQLLETQGGIPKTHIKLLTDAKATVGDFRNHFGDWLRMRVKPDSTVYVYYAGHGTPNPKTGEAYLVPWEGHPDFPSGLYPLKELYETLNKLPAKEMIVMLDSCFSGGAGRSVLAKGSRPMVVTMENPLLAGGKVVVLAAATGNQISSDYDKAGHGLFTHALLTGLSGEADADKDGIVTIKEVFPYVRDQVAHTAVEELNREQTPVLLPGEEILGKRIAMPLTRTRGSEPTQEAKVREFDETVLSWDKAKAQSYDVPRRITREITGKDGAPMVLIPAGDFRMIPAETFIAGGTERQSVSLGAFYLDKFEVTNRLFRKFVSDTGYETEAEKEGKARVLSGDGTWPEVSGANWRKPEGGETVFMSSRAEYPVVSVSWYDADAYCRWAGKQLPTEAQFQYALQAGKETTYWWGDGGPRPVANLADEAYKRKFPSDRRSMMGYDDGFARTAPVGSFDQNLWGFHDMIGNVSEWTADSSGSTGSWKVVAGGSWDSGPEYDRSAGRVRFATDSYADVGFRCAKEVQK